MVHSQDLAKGSSIDQFEGTTYYRRTSKKKPLYTVVKIHFPSILKSLLAGIEFESRRGMNVCVCCIRTVVWNISDMKDGRI